MQNDVITDDAVQTIVASVPASDDKIVCHIDNVRVHMIASHIAKNHADTWTVERYEADFPGAALMSKTAEGILERKRAEKLEAAKNAAVASAANVSVAPAQASMVASFATMHEIFELGNAPAARSTSGAPINVTVMSGHDADSALYLAELDNDYVFSIDLLKKVVIGFELNIPVYLWGFHGTGKTTILEQACCRTKRPFMRVQHGLNMQESDVLGQWTVRNGSTEFQLGPLAMAMLYGWVYCADEYDFAMPGVTSVYQPVLEGKALIIKDAPPVFRRIAPHPQFRFVATGNTNGVGDETGLYQGTMIQNAANYSRFGITEEVKYMDPKIEESVLAGKTGAPAAVIKKLVKFANDIRQQFEDGKISMTVSPREMIRSATLGMAYGGNWRQGIELAFANRLSRVDRKVVLEYADRVFGQ
jgi:cobaltochelatase CobS